MNLMELVRMSVVNLLNNKLRSALTMLGIVIGVGSVIALQSIGEGTIQDALASVQRAGANLITVSPSTQSFGGVAQSSTTQTLTLEDYEALSTDSSITAALAVAPEYNGAGQLVNGSVNSFGRMIGTTDTYPTVRDQTLASGEWFTESDVSSTKMVVVLGSNQAKTLFPDGDAVGKTIRINRTAFTVVGVMNSKGGSGFGSVDDQVYMPITTAQAKLLGPRGEGSLGTGKTVSSIVLKAKDPQSVEKLIGEVTNLLRDRHKITASDDFTITNQQDQLQSARDQQNTLNIFLLVIASISLFVGGIGIMNIMLVTVTERTREIGIRKAIGAKPTDILFQFIIESITLCFVGGFFGAGLGIIASQIVNATFIHTVISVPVIFLAIGFAVAVGLFFGIYPARRASRLNPIDALRYE